MYNFDEVIDRKGTNAVKLERCKALFGTDNVLPLWVADMDFRTPDFILNAISERLKHPILGYSVLTKSFYSLTQKWLLEHHHWDTKTEWIGFLPGIVPGLAFAVQCFTQPEDGVLVQPPVYYPFFNVIKNNHRVVVQNPLQEVNGRYAMNYEALEAQFTHNTKLFILCNPHNPGGRVWTKDELLKLAAICEKHHVLVVSDEIHADMTFEGNTHIPFASISHWAQNNTITLMAATKVFNMPALVSSYYVIPNADLRHKFASFLEVSEISSGNLFAYIGVLAAYEHGEPWRIAMLRYVKNNIDYVVDFLKNNVPQVVPMIPEASFLVWLDCSALGMETDVLHQFFALKAGLGFNKGTVFGTGGEFHLRMNVACARSVLEQAMFQLKAAVEANEK